MSRVVASMRKAFTVEIGGKSRRFWTEAAAYYAIAKSLIGAKYLAAMKAADRCSDEHCGPMDDLAEELGIPAEIVTARAVRGYALFNSVEQVGHEGQGRVDHAYFDPKKWTAYVRPVAKKLRAMDARRGAA